MPVIEKKAVQSLLDQVEPSPALSDELIKAAQSGNPSLLAGLRGATWSKTVRSQADYWGNNRGKALALAATTFGIPERTIINPAVDAMENILGTAMAPAGSMGELKVQFGKMGISIVTAALSPIPIVGAIAEAVGGIANLLIDMFAMDAEEAKIVFPPGQEYTEELDAHVAETVRMDMSIADWSSLMMPRFSANIQHQRRGDEGRTLFLSGGPGTGVGYVPGTQRILGAIQVDVDRDERLSRRWTGGLVQNVGDWYPTAAQMMTAIWGQVAEPGPYLYFIDTDKILSAWENYVGATIEYAQNRWGNVGKYRKAELALAMKQYYATLNPDPPKSCPKPCWLWGFMPPWSPAWTGPTIVDAFVRPNMEAIKKRQHHQLARLTCAYVDPEGAAFKGDALLLGRLNSMRDILLRHPARFEIVLEDVIDPVFLQQLKNSGVTGMHGPMIFKARGGGTASTSGALDPNNPPDGHVPGPQGGAPGVPPPGRRGRRVLPYVLAGAGLGYLGYKALKRRRVL